MTKSFIGDYKLKPKTIDAIRDLAVSVESKDLELAQDLMLLAHKSRPKGSFIKRKLDDYTLKLGNLNSPSNILVRNLFESKELAIIPIGFRCFTSMRIREDLGLRQASLPFDSGFFSPESVASVLLDPKIDLRLSLDDKNHSVCMKCEQFNDKDHGLGIQFNRTSYDEIESLLIDKNMDGINSYLDSTFGYYTLDEKHKFVLAHYNWHKFADFSKSGGITNPEENLPRISEMLNKRLTRMFDLCKSANDIIFVFGNYQGYRYIKIDEKVHSLEDFSLLNKVVEDLFPGKAHVVLSQEVDTADKVLTLLGKTN